ncbi:MAG TPA: hypothetical protein VL087_09325 [Nitrospirota bacterium]|nr:hypothetical protein [Nitrospirota bacterium]
MGATIKGTNIASIAPIISSFGENFPYQMKLWTALKDAVNSSEKTMESQRKCQGLINPYLERNFWIILGVFLRTARA